MTRSHRRDTHVRACHTRGARRRFPIIAAALDLQKPLLGVCRGHQELNVALGGTITPSVNDAFADDVAGAVYHGFPTDAASEVSLGEDIAVDGMPFQNVKCVVTVA